MNSTTKENLIRQIAALNYASPDKNLVLWSRHATVELANEGWRPANIERALVTGVVIEDYPTRTRRLPDCLVLGFLDLQRPFHAVVALDTDNQRLLMVTVYRPLQEEWSDDWRTRKR